MGGISASWGSWPLTIIPGRISPLFPLLHGDPKEGWGVKRLWAKFLTGRGPLLIARCRLGPPLTPVGVV